MQAPNFYNFDDIDTKEVAPGFFSKLIHTETNTLNFLEVKKGSAIGRHQHVHQQCSFGIEGRFELTVDGVPQVLENGAFAIIPSNVWHSGVALTDCKLIDVFSPVREDYRELGGLVL
jgi:quercetin dioxygenase-like cupin family protein